MIPIIYLNKVNNSIDDLSDKDKIAKLDKINSQRAAVLAESFRSIKKMTPALYEKAKKALTRLRETAKLSDSTREIVGKILDA